MVTMKTDDDISCRCCLDRSEAESEVADYCAYGHRDRYDRANKVYIRAEMPGDLSVPSRKLQWPFEAHQFDLVAEDPRTLVRWQREDRLVTVSSSTPSRTVTPHIREMIKSNGEQ